MKNYILTLSLLFPLCALAQADKTTPYVFPAFTQGNVLQKSGGTTSASMNYNTLTQEMLFMQGDTKIVLDLSDNVDTIYLQDRKFIPVGQLCYEKLTDTKVALYQQHFSKTIKHGKNADLDQQVNNTITSANAQGIRTTSGPKGPTYEDKLPEGYELVPQDEFWLKQGKSFYSAKTLKKIAKVFPDKEAAMEAYVKDNKLDIAKAVDLAKLVVFLNK